MDTGSRLTCLTIVSPSSLIKELEHPFQDPIQEEEASAQVQICERNKTVPGKETVEKKRHKEEKTNVSQAEPEPRCTSHTKKKGDMKSLAKPRELRSRTSQVVVSEVKAKQRKMSKRRLLLRKKCGLKRLGHRK